MQRNDAHWSLEEQLAGLQLPTQVGRASEESGIEAIMARSHKPNARTSAFGALSGSFDW